MAGPESKENKENKLEESKPVASIDSKADVKPAYDPESDFSILAGRHYDMYRDANAVADIAADFETKYASFAKDPHASPREEQRIAQQIKTAFSDFQMSLGAVKPVTDPSARREMAEEKPIANVKKLARLMDQWSRPYAGRGPGTDEERLAAKLMQGVDTIESYVSKEMKGLKDLGRVRERALDTAPDSKTAYDPVKKFRSNIKDQIKLEKKDTKFVAEDKHVNDYLDKHTYLKGLQKRLEDTKKKFFEGEASVAAAMQASSKNHDAVYAQTLMLLRCMSEDEQRALLPDNLKTLDLGSRDVLSQLKFHLKDPTALFKIDYINVSADGSISVAFSVRGKQLVKDLLTLSAAQEVKGLGETGEARKKVKLFMTNAWQLDAFTIKNVITGTRQELDQRYFQQYCKSLPPKSERIQEISKVANGILKEDPAMPLGILYTKIFDTINERKAERLEFLDTFVDMLCDYGPGRLAVFYNARFDTLKDDVRKAQAEVEKTEEDLKAAQSATSPDDKAVESLKTKLLVRKSNLRDEEKKYSKNCKNVFAGFMLVDQRPDGTQGKGYLKRRAGTLSRHQYKVIADMTSNFLPENVIHIFKALREPLANKWRECKFTLKYNAGNEEMRMEKFCENLTVKQIEQLAKDLAKDAGLANLDSPEAPAIAMRYLKDDARRVRFQTHYREALCKSYRENLVEKCVQDHKQIGKIVDETMPDAKDSKKQVAKYPTLKSKYDDLVLDAKNQPRALTDIDQTKLRALAEETIKVKEPEIQKNISSHICNAAVLAAKPSTNIRSSAGGFFQYFAHSGKHRQATAATLLSTERQQYMALMSDKEVNPRGNLSDQQIEAAKFQKAKNLAETVCYDQIKGWVDHNVTTQQEMKLAVEREPAASQKVGRP